MLKLLRENRFPRIWMPSPENRDLRQLLWHRHRLVQMRTRIMNQLQAVAMNEALEHYSHIRSQAKQAAIRCLEQQPSTPILEETGHKNGHSAVDCTLEMRQMGWAHFVGKGLQSEAEAILTEVSTNGRRAHAEQR
jgi:hypothetical protein